MFFSWRNVKRKHLKALSRGRVEMLLAAGGRDVMKGTLQQRLTCNGNTTHSCSHVITDNEVLLCHSVCAISSFVAVSSKHAFLNYCCCYFFQCSLRLQRHHNT